MPEITLSQIGLTALTSAIAGVVSALVTSFLASRKGINEERRAALKGALDACGELYLIVEFVTERAAGSATNLKRNSDDLPSLQTLSREGIQKNSERARCLITKILSGAPHLTASSGFFGISGRWYMLATDLEGATAQLRERDFLLNLTLSGETLSQELRILRELISHSVVEAASPLRVAAAIFRVKPSRWLGSVLRRLFSSKMGGPTP
ncbi:hypothetical protein BOSEA31B_20339 [Hyphomicrobiales bacterium]|nr:hypothetical protein BOSEA31B_20339 [Hyphomicrobiales bacterium]CAH1702285.1 hypothetical protein BOSEA1005_30157 [Hyphomicrobiales bacterium]CAI0346488.1 hypothetical protein BO1005MUT1_510129 [Hyphomicrobiales bacterium]